MNFNFLKRNISFIPDEVSHLELGKFLNGNFDALMYCAEAEELFELLESKISGFPEGNIVECGVWKGGSSAIIFHALSSCLAPDSKIHLFDFFGANNKIEKNELKRVEMELLKDYSSVSFKPPVLKEVKEFLNRLEVPNERLVFHQGDVNQTLITASVSPIAVLHLDLDFYYLTSMVLDSLYSKLRKGGIVIINDYGVQSLACKQAIDEFRVREAITAKLITVGNHIAYWIK